MLTTKFKTKLFPLLALLSKCGVVDVNILLSFDIWAIVQFFKMERKMKVKLTRLSEEGKKYIFKINIY